VRAVYERHKPWFWGAAWLLTRGLIMAQIGFFNHITATSTEDVFLYESWSDSIAHTGALPTGELWQYPPGAALLMVIPRIAMAPKGFGPSFAVTMLVFDLIAFLLIARLSRKQGRDTGVWIWLLGIPALRAVPLLRFDMVGTTLAVAALAVIHRRPHWFGFLAGLGAMVKVWPIVVLFGEWDRRRLLRAGAAAAGTIAVVFAISALSLDGDVFEFLGNQEARGLQVEAVAATPWHVREVITGEAPTVESRSGTSEIVSGPADFVSGALDWMTLAVLALAALWWTGRARAIRAGRADLADPAVSRDFVFTLVLLLVIVSRVLSPQYLLWLFGLAAVALTSSRSSIARPAWILIGAAVITTAAYGHQGAWGPAPVYGSSFNMVIRNVALLVAAADASRVMYLLLRRPSEREPAKNEAVAEARTRAAGLHPASGR
jgi:hypothetical protein